MDHQFFIGLDLGQAQDYTALAILERIEAPPPEPPSVVYVNAPPKPKQPQPEPSFECRHLERLPLNTRYPAIIEHVRDLIDKPELKGKSLLVIDATGVGRPVADSFNDAGLSHVGVTITGGDSVNRDGRMYRVPKRILVSTLQVLLQSERLKVAPNPLRETLITEMLNFRVTVTEAANDTYAGRTGTHDDLILAVALAAWRANFPATPPPLKSTIRRGWLNRGTLRF